MIEVTSSREALLALPDNHNWNDVGWWNSLLIIPTTDLHDSGYAHIAIIGCRYEGDKAFACQILAYPDDITWPTSNGDWENRIRTEAFVENGALHLWSSYRDFSLDSPTSSTMILTRKANRSFK